jgi:NADH-quinone oxidoreductase subunit C
LQSNAQPTRAVPENKTDMSGTAFLERLKSKFGDKITGENLAAIDPWIEVSPDGLVAVCKYLRDESDLRFNMLNCISGVDYFEPDEKKAAKVDWKPHTEVVYHLSSLPHKTTLVVKVILPRWKDDKPGELPEVPSVSGVWSTADWHEREVYDLSGVNFIGHPDLRRILCPEDWVGHPLRKDYQMPLEYHGIRGR